MQQAKSPAEPTAITLHGSSLSHVHAAGCPVLKSYIVSLLKGQVLSGHREWCTRDHYLRGWEMKDMWPGWIPHMAETLHAIECIGPKFELRRGPFSPVAFFFGSGIPQQTMLA